MIISATFRCLHVVYVFTEDGVQCLWTDDDFLKLRKYRFRKENVEILQSQLIVYLVEV